MSDRELLELAAKAAGMEWCHWYEESQLPIVDHRVWNPLIDDGDAFRLAVKLKILVMASIDAQAITENSLCFAEHFGDDELKAMRRAIVRAAAELGRAMP
jgi:hypothetical protein